MFHPDWHKGVVGIVASRLIESYYRPTIVLTENNGKLVGSARSVKGFDVYDAIDACSEYVEQFGDINMRQALRLKENLEVFTAKFESIVAETIKEEMLIPQVSIDAVLNISDIDHKLYRIFRSKWLLLDRKHVAYIYE